MSGRAITQKILAAHAVEGEAVPGAILTVRPDIVLLNDVSGPLSFEQFARMGAARVFDPERIVLVADHFAPAPDVTAAGAIAMTRDFARDQRIPHFYEPGRGGIEHTLLAELGLIGHGGIVFGADSHTCTAGAFNALGIGFGSTDLAGALALGQLWMRVPDSIRVELTGTPGPYVTGKDVILELIRRIGSDGAADASLEFGGPGLAALGMDERMAVANMAVEAGADMCVFEGDARSAADMAARGMAPVPAVMPDADAVYRQRIAIDLSALRPMVARPPSPASGVAVEALRGQRVDQVYVGNCSNGTLTDLRQVAAVLRGRQVAPEVRMVVVPATQKIWRAALAEGLLDTIAAAGAAISTPTCGACFGGHMGILAAGETAIATTNRNYRGRMGHPDSQVFLSNAWVAAAAAVAGEIRPPEDVLALEAMA
ncbi:aconitase/3-isopropylmalate dehydratase large subunit family protein [Pseudoroseomonas cervicalis]|uniref:aconitase/3-isopropylmalate dehydratase large subunit family protein n=1 Tax=Teichococcus cervicalis TaxID=204525 RepID=UPI0022F15C9C|nr:aconitase/3-isopropylmalate dehydratase large subunit family protein [Pseudoroseomonas cervicalis]WBV45299.1 aconitase/3-isopropylmalate dehydratase large subunit family protein [Pseudoroseomonas cervicalis]